MGENGLACRFAATELKNDPKVVRAACLRDPRAVGLCAPGVEANKELMLDVVQAHPNALTLHRDQLDRDVCKYFVPVPPSEEQPRLLWPTMRDDPDVMRCAVRHAGLQLQYAAEGLRSSFELVQAAVEQNGRALEFASPELQQDSTLVRLAVQTGGSLQLALDQGVADRELILQAIAFHPSNLGLLKYTVFDSLRADPR